MGGSHAVWCKKSLARMVLDLLKTLLGDASYCLHSRRSLPTLTAKKPQPRVKISLFVKKHKANLLQSFIYVTALKKGKLLESWK